MAQEHFDTLLQFFKVLGNESRLKILGLLANQEWSVSELAEFLDLREPTVSHHLSAMKDLGLVSVRADGNTRIYALNTKYLESMNRDIFSQKNLAQLVDNATEDSWEQKVIQSFVEGDRLKGIPARLKKRQVILKWLVEKFEWDRRYQELEVNNILKEYHPDHAALRRYLVENKLMDRDGREYWRI
jgi:predicted transcriptional regulator